METYGFEESDDEESTAIIDDLDNIMDDLDATANFDLDLSLLVATNSFSEFSFDEIVDVKQLTPRIQDAENSEENIDSFYAKQNTSRSSFLYSTQTQSSVQDEGFSKTLRHLKKGTFRFINLKRWQNRLEILSKLTSSSCTENDHKTKLKIKDAFSKGMKMLGGALRNRNRPVYLHEILEEYAVKIVGAGEMLTLFGSDDFVKEFPNMLRTTVMFWMRLKEPAILISRAWQHSIIVIALMLHRVSSLKVLLAAEKTLSSVLVRLTEGALEEKMVGKVVYAVRDIHRLQGVVEHQLVSASQRLNLELLRN